MRLTWSPIVRVLRSCSLSFSKPQALSALVTGFSGSHTCLGTQPWSLEVLSRENRGCCKLPAFHICQEFPSTLHLSVGGLQGEQEIPPPSPRACSRASSTSEQPVVWKCWELGQILALLVRTLTKCALDIIYSRAPHIPSELCCFRGSGRLSIHLGLNAGFPGDNGGCSSNYWESLFPPAPLSPWSLLLLLSHSQLPRGSMGAVLGCRQKCQQGPELPGTFCLSSFLLSSLIDGPV